MTHAHNLRNGLHWQTLTVSRPYRFVALLPEVFVGLLRGGFALGIGLRKGGKTRSGLGCLAF